MSKVKYIVINKIPRDVDRIAIPEKGIEGISVSEVYHSIWWKDDGIQTESPVILDNESYTLFRYPESFRHKYYKYKKHFQSIDSICHKIIVDYELGVLSSKTKQERIDKMINDYLSENKLLYEELFGNVAFRFEYWIDYNNRQFSKWYNTETEAFNRLLLLINAINTGINPVLEL